MPDRSFSLAQSILLQYACTYQIGSNDALHLAIMKRFDINENSFIMVTSDNSMKKVCEKIRTRVYDPEKDV